MSGECKAGQRDKERIVSPWCEVHCRYEIDCLRAKLAEAGEAIAFEHAASMKALELAGAWEARAIAAEKALEAYKFGASFKTMEARCDFAEHAGYTQQMLAAKAKLEVAQRALIDGARALESEAEQYRDGDTYQPHAVSLRKLAASLRKAAL